MAEITILYEGPIVTRSEAKALGEKYYFKGEPCKRGHVQRRYVKSKCCITCSLEDSRTDQRRAVARIYAQSTTGKETRKKALRKWRTTERGQQIIARWIASEVGKASQKRKSEKFRTSAKALIIRKRFLQTEKGKATARRSVTKRRALKMRAVGEFTAEEERKLRERQKICHICGKRFTDNNPATLDHVIALVNGGANDASNMALAHGSCNSRKKQFRTHLI